MAKKKTITVQGTEIRLKRHEGQDYFCLTDIARYEDRRTDSIIQNYLRNGGNLDFLATWETLHNQNFNPMNFNGIRSRVGAGAFVLSVKEWIEKTGAKGIISSPGRYGGTFAHKDIALQFATWISPEFYLYMVKEFDRLKTQEAQMLGESWNIQRLMTKANHYLQTTSVRENLVPLLQWNTRMEALYQASEADMLNLIVFGMKAKGWAAANPAKKGNIRDHATKLELIVLNNLQAINAMLIEDKMDKKGRAEKLLQVAATQMQVLMATIPVKELKEKSGN